MQPTVDLTPRQDIFDKSLLDWFLGLTVEERLAELESRVAFFVSLREKHESQLSRDSETP